MTEEFAVMFWGVFVSLLEERFGKFQDLSPKAKQLVNAVAAFIVPAVLLWWVNPWWQADWGNSEEFVNAIIVLIAPAFVWAFSQLTHIIESTSKVYKQHIEE